MTLGDEAHELRDVDGVPSVWLHSGGDCELAGSRYYQSALERVAGPKTPDGHEDDVVAWLVPEPNNLHDRNAVRVDVKGEKVGYLSRADAELVQEGILALGKHYGRPVACHGTITGGQNRPYKRGKGTVDRPYEVTVDFAFPSLPKAARPTIRAAPHAPVPALPLPGYAHPGYAQPPQTYQPAYAAPPPPVAPRAEFLTVRRIVLFVVAAFAGLFMLLVAAACVIAIQREASKPAPAPATRPTAPAKALPPKLAPRR